jgi:putative SOS response-associated peptidase YedK
MRGRYDFFPGEFSDLRIRFNLDKALPDFKASYNIAPGKDVPVIVRHGDRNIVKLMRWGLVPSWAQDPAIGNQMINARCETLDQKPSFKQLLGSRRCLVPADGFFEWVRHEVACVIVRRRHPTEPAAPSAVPYEEGRIGNEPSKSPRTMYSSVSRRV